MTEMIDSKTDLKPCPFCGRKPESTWTVTELGTKYPALKCECFGKRIIEVKWNNAYCWQRIEQLEADYSSEVQAKELAIEKAIALEKEIATVKELSELRFRNLYMEQKRNWDLKKEINELLWKKVN